MPEPTGHPVPARAAGRTVSDVTDPQRRPETHAVADIEPLDVDGVRTLAAGTIGWAVAFLVLLAFRAELAEQGRLWWLWTCLAGVRLGLVSLEYCRRRRNRLRSEPPRPPEASPLGAAGL